MKEEDLQHELAYLAKNKLIGKQLIDAKDHYDIQANKQGISIFFICSIMIHASIIAFVAYTYTPPELFDQQLSVETSLLTTQDLLTLQNQIRENQNAASNQANNKNSTEIVGNINTIKGNNSVDVSVSSQGSPISESNTVTARATSNTITQKNTSVVKSDVVFTPSKTTQEIDAKIAEQNEQFNKALEAFTQTQEKKASSKLTEQEQKLADEAEREIRKVNELKKAEQQVAKIVANNKTELEKAAEMLKTMEQEKVKQSKKVANNLATDGRRTTASSSSESKSQTSKPNNTTVSSSTHISAINAKIKSNFTSPTNVQNMTAIVTVYVDKKGNVKRAIVTDPSPSDALNEAGRQAVLKSSPLPINANDPATYPSFPFPFHGK